MWSKLATILVGAFIEKLPALISYISKVIGEYVEKAKNRSKRKKKKEEAKETAGRLNNAQTKEEAKDEFSKMP